MAGVRYTFEGQGQSPGLSCRRHATEGGGDISRDNTLGRHWRPFRAGRGTDTIARIVGEHMAGSRADHHSKTSRCGPPRKQDARRWEIQAADVSTGHRGMSVATDDAFRRKRPCWCAERERHYPSRVANPLGPSGGHFCRDGEPASTGKMDPDLTPGVTQGNQPSAGQSRGARFPQVV